MAGGKRKFSQIIGDENTLNCNLMHESPKFKNLQIPGLESKQFVLQG